MAISITENIFYETVKSDFKDYKEIFSKDELFKIYDNISYIADFGKSENFIYVIKELKNYPLEQKNLFWSKVRDMVIKTIPKIN